MDAQSPALDSNRTEINKQEAKMFEFFRSEHNVVLYKKVWLWLEAMYT